MYHRSQIAVCRLLSRYPIQRSSKPISQFPAKSISTISNQWISQPSIPNPNFSNSLYHNSFFRSARQFNSDTNKIVDEINFKFAEAREEIEMAIESKETVYFNEEAESARAAVNEVLEMFNGLLEKLPENEKGALQRSMGLKIEQLKAELAQLNDE